MRSYTHQRKYRVLQNDVKIVPPINHIWWIKVGQSDNLWPSARRRLVAWCPFGPRGVKLGEENTSGRLHVPAAVRTTHTTQTASVDTWWYIKGKLFNNFKKWCLKCQEDIFVGKQFVTIRRMYCFLKNRYAKSTIDQLIIKKWCHNNAWRSLGYLNEKT